LQLNDKYVLRQKKKRGETRYIVQEPSLLNDPTKGKPFCPFIGILLVSYAVFQPI
jgi:hypothetical protein